jgi:syntaxin of plants SYP7
MFMIFQSQVSISFLPYFEALYMHINSSRIYRNTKTNNKIGKGGSGGWASSETDGVELTHQQHQMLQTIQSRDEDFDMQLDQIGEGIQDLAEIAQMQNEEVKRQNQMLDNVGTKIDAAHDHIENVNAKMKETLQQVRSADKVCVDIMCIVLMVGLAAVLYQIIKKNGI